jgi:hypothetical protein
MTARPPFTQAQVRRAIAAARKEGLRVVAIRTDGTVLVQAITDPVAPSLEPPQDGAASEWEEFKA